MQMTKKVISVVLAVLMVVSMMSVMATTTAFAAFSDDKIAVFYSDSGSWDSNGVIKVHYWNNNGDTTQWPGDDMTYCYDNSFGQSVYRALIPANATGIQFNQGGNQTATLTPENGGWYNNDGKVGNAYVEATPATCTTDGNIAHYLLDGHYYKTDLTVTDADGVKVSATGHDYVVTEEWVEQSAGSTYRYLPKYTITCQNDSSVLETNTYSSSKVTANADGTFTYSCVYRYKLGDELKKFVSTKTVGADGVIMCAGELYAAVATGGFYKLGADIVSDASNNNVVKADTTIDGQGKTISACSTSKYLFNVTKAVSLTLNDVTLDGLNYAKRAVSTGSSGDDNSALTVKMENVTVKNFVGDDTYVGAVYLFSHANGVFNNCTFTGNTTTGVSPEGNKGSDIWAGAAANVTISGGSYDGVVFVNGGTATATVEGAANVAKLTAIGGSTVNVDDTATLNLDIPEGYRLDSSNKVVAFNPVHHAAVAPTCEEDGTVEYWEFDGKNYSDAACTNELTSIVDPATGHDYVVTEEWVEQPAGSTYQYLPKYTITCQNDSSVLETKTYSSSKVTANADGTFTYSCVYKYKLNGVYKKFDSTKTVGADGVIMCAGELNAAVATGGNYKLGADIVSDASPNNVVKADTTIDGQGRTISAGSTSKYLFNVTETVSLTLTNVTLDGLNSAKRAVSTGHSGNDNSALVVVMENVTVKNFVGDDTYVGAVYLFSHANGVFNNCTFTGNTTSGVSPEGNKGSDIWAGAAANVTISGGSYDGVVFVNGGTATATVEGTANVAKLTAIGGSTVNVADTATLNLDIPEGYRLDSSNKVVVFNPVHHAAVAPTFDEDGTVEYWEFDGKYYSDAECTTEITQADTVIPQLVAVAEVNGTKYETVAEAVAAAFAGDTIKLLADTSVGALTVNKSFTLDLDGKKLEVTGVFTQTAGEVELKNGTINTNVTDVFNTQGSDTKLTFGAGLTVNSGSSAVYAQSGSEVVIAGASISTDGIYTPIYGDGGSTITMTSGSVKAKKTSAIGVAPGIINISGGTVETESGSPYAAVYVIGETSTMSLTNGATIKGKHEAVQVTKGTATIDGATIESENIAVNSGFNGGTGTVTIVSGTVKGIVGTNGGTMSVSGGSFDRVVPEKYCANGYKPVTTPDSNNMYTVTPKTLRDLMDEDAGTGATVTFVDNTTQEIGGNVTKAALLGVQLRKPVAIANTEYEDGSEAVNDLRYIAAITADVKAKATDYGFIVETANGKMKFSAKGTTNTVLKSGKDGLEYVTFAITNFSEAQKNTKMTVSFYVTDDAAGESLDVNDTVDYGKLNKAIYANGAETPVYAIVDKSFNDIKG